MIQQSLPYRLRIGVTGHRHLDNEAETTRAVDQTLDLIESTLQQSDTTSRGLLFQLDRLLIFLAKPLLRWVKHSRQGPKQGASSSDPTGIQWTVVSPLAEGADQIVAELVLNRPNSRLKAVLPLPEAEYMKDFGDTKRFTELKAKTDAPTVLNSELGKDQASISRDERNEAYFDAGRQVVNSCEILIAIWNGKPANGRGGTGDIVEYAVDRGKTIIWIDANDPLRPAQLLSAPTESTDREEPDSADTSQDIKRIPFPVRAKDLSPGFHRLSAFNRDTGFNSAALQRNAQEEKEHFQNLARESGMSIEVVDPVIDQLVPHYVRSNQLAIHYQSLYVFAAKWLFRLSSLAVTIVTVQVLFFPDALWLILFEILAMLGAFGLLRISHREAWHEKWLNDRHIAEWIRSGMFTSLLPASEHKHGHKGVALPFYQGPEDWIVDSHQPVINEVRRTVPNDLPLGSLKKFLVKGWLEDQADWHQSTAEKKSGIAHFYHRTGTIVFTATLLMAIMHLFGVGHVDHHAAEADKTAHHVEKSVPSHSPAQKSPDGEPDHPTNDSPTQESQDSKKESESGEGESKDHSGESRSLWEIAGLLITLMAIILPAWGASVHAIGSLLEYDRIAARSKRMSSVLGDIAARANSVTTPEGFQREIHTAENIMASENQEWLASLRFRGLVLPG